MTEPAVDPAVVPVAEPVYASYLDEATLPYPFCPGCGHGGVLDCLDAALVRLQPDPRKLVIVTDIGCSGLSDRFFAANAFHGLHGRSVTYATGVKLANPELKVIVLMGDGGCGIGGHHLINAARRNIGVTVLVFNNFNYGMTGGQHSATTLPGSDTPTTPYGSLERPLDICATVAVNGAGFVARATSFDRDLTDLIAAAVQYDGFALIDIWELCAAYYAPSNRFSRKRLGESMQSLGFERGLLRHADLPEYSRAYRAAVAGQRGQPVMPPRPLEVKYTHSLDSRLDGVIAGAAGMKIGSAAAAFCRGALLAGLWAAQQDDYPVTVRSGYSLSEVVLSPGSIHFPGISDPDWMVVLFPEGLRAARPRLAQLDALATAYIHKALLPVETPARVVPLDFPPSLKEKHWALAALARVLQQARIYPLEALREAVAMNETYAAENLAALDALQNNIDQSR